MADVSAIPFINFGLSQAQQAQAGASANLQNQQALAAQQQNQLMAAKMPMMLAAYKEAQAHITDHSGQHNGDTVPTPDYDPSSNNSGAAPAGSNANSTVRPYDLIGRDSDTTNVVQGALQGKYNVDPSGTPQEQAAIEQAYNYSNRMKLLGDKGLSDSADSQLDQAKYERDMAVKDRTNKANLSSSQDYETLQNVNTADHPWQQLYAVNKEAATRLKAANPNADEETLDELTRSATGQAGAFIHRFTGRPTDKGEDGIFRDKDTQQPVLGVTPAGFKPEDIQKIRETGNQPEERTVDGRKVTKFKYEWAGFDNVDQYVAKSVAQARALQVSQNKIEGKRQGAVVIQANAGVPANQRIPAPGQQQPQSVAVDQANTPAAQGSAAAHQLQKPPGPGGQPAPPPPTTVVPPPKSPTAPAGGALASTNSPTGKLDMSDIQKTHTPNTPGILPDRATPSDADKEYWDGPHGVRAKNAEMGDSATSANTAIQIATNAQNALKNDAATGGSAATRQWIATALGNPDAMKFLLGDATSSAILRKMLGNASFQNLADDAKNGRLTYGSKTIQVAMQQLSASPEMTPDAIRALSGQLIKNATYEKQKAMDYGRYREAGGDVTDFDRWYGSKYPNKTTIDTGNTGEGEKTYSVAEAAKLTKGTRFKGTDNNYYTVR